jgi:ferredoxin
MKSAPIFSAEASYVSTAIYYFSGTGNSLHVARELQKRIPESNLVPIVRLLNQDTIQTSAETVGFVFPNFCLTVPIPVHDFLKKVDVTSARYIFALCTRGGTPSEAFDYINEILKEQEKALNAQLNVTMPWNHPVGKENLPATATRERIEQLDSEMQDKLDVFSRKVIAREDYVPADTDATYKLPAWASALSALAPKSFNYASHYYAYQKLVPFYSDSKCTGCGVCEQVCLGGKIEMVDNRPCWKGDVTCYACFACINFCPQQSIQVAPKFLTKSYTAVNERYHHPAVTYKDIAEQC